LGKQAFPTPAGYAPAQLPTFTRLTTVYVTRKLLLKPLSQLMNSNYI